MPEHRPPEVQPARRRINVAGPLVLLVCSPLLVPLLVLLAMSHVLRRACLYLSVWLLWCSRGTHVLFVYSRSPHWQAEIEQDWIPRLPGNSVVLNWSNRKAWSRWSLAAKVFRHFLGDREHTPSAIVFRAFHGARIFRFHGAFLAAKHGNREPLGRLEAEFLAACEALRPFGTPG